MTWLQKIGGRKAAKGYLYAILITAMAFPLDATFEVYAGFLAGALLGTQFAIAYEDIKRGGK